MQCSSSKAPGHAPARSTKLRREDRTWVMPESSVVLHSSTAVNTECERLDSLFIIVSPILRFSCPCSSSAATSPTAGWSRHAGRSAPL
jgi:hypothetical protein